ncbi:hypothetical protein ACOMHN_046065 [Nucella lapillus]
MDYFERKVSAPVVERGGVSVLVVLQLCACGGVSALSVSVVVFQFCESHQQGADLLVTDQYGMTALHHAARFGHRTIVKFLIDNAPPMILDMAEHEKGQTALHKAAWYQRRTICHMLVAAGASLTRLDFEGNSPRQQALLAEDTELAAYLESQEHLQLVVKEDQETAV